MDLEEAYKNGASLFDALIRFGNEKEVAAFKEVAEQIRILPVPVAALQALAAVVEGKPEGQKQLQESQKIYSGYSSLHRALEKQLLHRLRKGDLLALGYVLPRGVNDRVAVLPKDVWDGKIDWSKSSIEGNGLAAAAIRVCRPQAPLDLPSPRPVGRPSRQTEIIEAFQDLDDRGLIDREKSLLSHFPLVRKRVWEMHPAGDQTAKNLGDQVLRNVLRPLFKRG